MRRRRLYQPLRWCVSASSRSCDGVTCKARLIFASVDKVIFSGAVVRRATKPTEMPNFLAKARCVNSPCASRSFRCTVLARSISFCTRLTAFAMVKIRVIKELRRCNAECTTDLFDGAQCGVLRRVLKTRQRTDGNAELLGKGTMRLLALRLPNLPLNGLCGIHFSLAHLAEMVFPIWNK